MLSLWRSKASKNAALLVACEDSGLDIPTNYIPFRWFLEQRGKFCVLSKTRGGWVTRIIINGVVTLSTKAATTAEAAEALRNGAKAIEVSIDPVLLRGWVRYAEE